jgi:flavin-dependent oxidoreductase
MSTWCGRAGREQLEQLQRRLNLCVVHILTNPSPGWTDDTGFIDDAVLARHLVGDTAAAGAFVCGPPPMLAAALTALQRRGVAPKAHPLRTVPVRRALGLRGVHECGHSRRGIFTGAEKLKTPEELTLFGGVAGVALDHCYHQACDTINNLNTTVFGQMKDAAADVLYQLMLTRNAIVDGSKIKPGAAKNLANPDFRGETAAR